MSQVKLISYIFVCMFIFSCIKKDKSEPAKNELKFQIIDALNQGESDKALNLALQGQ